MVIGTTSSHLEWLSTSTKKSCPLFSAKSLDLAMASSAKLPLLVVSSLLGKHDSAVLSPQCHVSATTYRGALDVAHLNLDVAGLDGVQFRSALSHSLWNLNHWRYSIYIYYCCYCYYYLYYLLIVLKLKSWIWRPWSGYWLCLNSDGAGQQRKQVLYFLL